MPHAGWRGVHVSVNYDAEEQKQDTLDSNRLAPIKWANQIFSGVRKYAVYRILTILLTLLLALNSLITLLLTLNSHWGEKIPLNSLSTKLITMFYWKDLVHNKIKIRTHECIIVDNEFGSREEQINLFLLYVNCAQVQS